MVPRKWLHFDRYARWACFHVHRHQRLICMFPSRHVVSMITVILLAHFACLFSSFHPFSVELESFDVNVFVPSHDLCS
jgi:hypothetical protein